MHNPEAEAKHAPAIRQTRARGRVSPRKPTAVDKHVGRRLRLLRQMNDMSLERLAEIVDVAPQQIQKYEVGETRISASRIYEMSKIFSVPLSWFYDDLTASTSAEVEARIRRWEPANDIAGKAPGDASHAETSHEELLARYYALLTPEMREKLVDIARMLSEMASKRAG
jgi:transcriptional regulator with XRE-family HTH domain